MDKQEKARAACRDWYARNRERKLEANRLYKLAHSQDQKEYNQKYYKEHRSTLLPKHKKWYWDNRVYFLAYMRAYYQSHRSTLLPKHNAYMKAYYQAHKKGQKS